jgi:Probable Zinc-ribbon domain
MARPLTPGVHRPPCPRGHRGRVVLDWRRLGPGGRERTRYRCVPGDAGEAPHRFWASARGENHSRDGRCLTCLRAWRRGEGLPTCRGFQYVIGEAATTLASLGQGKTYRTTTREIHAKLGRVGRDGRGLPGSNLASVYLDVFGPTILAETVRTKWPRIVALDSWPLTVHDHSACCKTGPLHHRKTKPGLKPDDEGKSAKPDPQTNVIPFPRARLPDMWGPPFEPDAEYIDFAPPRTLKAHHYRSKVDHASPVIEVGSVLIAVGYDHPGDGPSPWLIRFAGAKDQPSWTDFLRLLPGRPEWVVSDRDPAIIPAVSDVWGSPIHYFSEKHLVKNMTRQLVLDGVTDPADPLWTLLDHAQYGPREWSQLEGAAIARGTTNLLGWILTNDLMMQGQFATRRTYVSRETPYPRSAGGCESVISAVAKRLGDRVQYLRNAQRLDALLELIRADISGDGSEQIYASILAGEPQSRGQDDKFDWKAGYDPWDQSSMRVLFQDAQLRKAEEAKKRRAPGRAAYQQTRRDDALAEMVQRGVMPLRSRGKTDRGKSAAGKKIADYEDLVAEWHPTANGALQPAEVQAAGGEMIWWRCPDRPYHEYRTTARSRTLGGSNCGFCAGKRVHPRDAISSTHPDIAAQWHPTRNGAERPDQFTWGSDHYAWWQCPKVKSHVWRAQISSRTIGNGCRQCSNRGRKGKPVEPDEVVVSTAAS